MKHYRNKQQTITKHKQKQTEKINETQTVNTYFEKTIIFLNNEQILKNI